jgi:glutamyl-Q tRNA(Asp) synthetase
VLGANGEKLSKQNGAAPLDLADPRAAVAAALRVLGLPAPADGALQDLLAQAVRAWASRWP